MKLPDFAWNWYDCELYKINCNNFTKEKKKKQQNASSDSQQLQDLKIATDQLMQQIHGKVCSTPNYIIP